MNEKIDIKSPIFKPKPGWGGQLKSWFEHNYEAILLPVVAVGTLAVGIYLVFLK